MKIKKQHILASALILALGAAVYLNWQFTGAPVKPSGEKELGAATYVSRNTGATADQSGRLNGASSPEATIAKARTERTQAQDKALSEAKNVLELSDTSEEAKAEAVKAATVIEKRILAQSNIEGILNAKGFSSVLCSVADNACTVSVLKTEMKDDSAMIIKDAVLSQLNIEFSNIVIVEV